MKSFAVLGLGRFGSTLARALTAAGGDVIAIDTRRELVEQVADDVANAVILDATDEKALEAQGVATVDCAVVCIGENFEANVLATIACKNLGVKLVVTRGATRNECRILERIGADEVIQPEEESARRLARRLLQPSILSVQELAEGVSVVQLQAPKHFHGRDLKDIGLRRRYGVTLVAIRRPRGEEKHEVIYPQADTVILSGDVLVVVGKDEDVRVLCEEA